MASVWGCVCVCLGGREGREGDPGGGEGVLGSYCGELKPLGSRDMLLDES